MPADGSAPEGLERVLPWLVVVLGAAMYFLRLGEPPIQSGNETM